jgi:hypothetical protein
MPGNGDFEAKCPAIWEFDFIKTLEAQRFFVGASVRSASWPGMAVQRTACFCTPVSLPSMSCFADRPKRWMLDSGAI